MSKYKKATLQKFAEIFKALSNQNRLQIFLRLVSCCQPGTVCSSEEELKRCAGEIGHDLGIVPSTVSHHLKALRQAGLIRMERNGQKIECWVEPAILSELEEFFACRVQA